MDPSLSTADLRRMRAQHLRAAAEIDAELERRQEALEETVRRLEARAGTFEERASSRDMAQKLIARGLLRAGLAPDDARQELITWAHNHTDLRDLADPPSRGTRGRGVRLTWPVEKTIAWFEAAAPSRRRKNEAR